MAVVNQYKFYGATVASAAIQYTFGSTVDTVVPAINETVIIKSILVSSAGTPTITLTNNGFPFIKSTLTANSMTELLTQPLTVEGGNYFKFTVSTSDSTTIGISYLNIKKEKID